MSRRGGWRRTRGEGRLAEAAQAGSDDLSSDTVIASELVALLEGVAHDQSNAWSRITQAVLAADLSDEARRAVERFIDSPGFEEALRHLIMQTGASYLWSLSIWGDEAQGRLRLGVSQGDGVDWGASGVHEMVVSELFERGIEL